MRYGGLREAQSMVAGKEQDYLDSILYVRAIAGGRRERQPIVENKSASGAKMKNDGAGGREVKLA